VTAYTVSWVNGKLGLGQSENEPASARVGRRHAPHDGDECAGVLPTYWASTVRVVAVSAVIALDLGNEGQMIASRRTALAAGALVGCERTASLASGGWVASAASPSPAGSRPPGNVPLAAVLTRAQIVARYGHLRPHSWGFGGPGVVRDLHTSRRVIALTFDACGGRRGSGYDRALIGFLRRREMPATLFLNSRWIDANPAVFRQLVGEPLFEIANHGTRHLPLSVTGRSAYGIPGTRNAGEVYDEVARNQAKLTRLLGVPPRWFRPGTGYCVDVAAPIVTAMGERLVSFSVNGAHRESGSAPSRGRRPIDEAAET